MANRNSFAISFLTKWTIKLPLVIFQTLNIIFSDGTHVDIMLGLQIEIWEETHTISDSRNQNVKNEAHNRILCKHSGRR